MDTVNSEDIRQLQLMYPHFKLGRGKRIIPKLEFGSSQNDQASVGSGAIVISPLRAKQMGEIHTS